MRIVRFGTTNGSPLCRDSALHLLIGDHSAKEQEKVDAVAAGWAAVCLKCFVNLAFVTAPGTMDADRPQIPEVYAEVALHADFDHFFRLLVLLQIINLDCLSQAGASPSCIPDQL